MRVALVEQNRICISLLVMLCNVMHFLPAVIHGFNDGLVAIAPHTRDGVRSVGVTGVAQMVDFRCSVGLPVQRIIYHYQGYHAGD